MSAYETPFAVVTATLGIGTDGTEDTYCVQDWSLSHTTESLSFQCMGTANPVTFPGLETWNGSCTLAYDSSGMDQLWGYQGNMIFTVVKTGGTRDLTFEGGIQITDVSATFDNNNLPAASITFVANGAITEVEAAT